MAQTTRRSKRLRGPICLLAALSGKPCTISPSLCCVLRGSLFLWAPTTSTQWWLMQWYSSPQTLPGVSFAVALITPASDLPLAPMKCWAKPTPEMRPAADGLL